MNTLSRQKRAEILHLLVEGNSLRATARIADVSFNTVTKLFVDAAKACADYQDRTLRNLSCKRLQLDEICDGRLVPSVVGSKRAEAFCGVLAQRPAGWAPAGLHRGSATLKLG